MPFLMRTKDGRAECFAIGKHSQIMHKWTDLRGNWGKWQPLGGEAKVLAAETNGNGLIEIFYVGTNGGVYHRYQVTPFDWSPEVAWQGSAKDITVIRNAYGHLEVFSIDTDDRLSHRYQTANSSRSWEPEWPAGQGTFGRASSAVTACRNMLGRIEVFYVGTDGRIYYRYQTGNRSEPWAKEKEFGGQAKQITCAQNIRGLLEVFYIGTNAEVYTRYQTGDSAAPWSPESRMGQTATHLSIGVTLNSEIELFIIGTDRQLYRNVQSNLVWNGWDIVLPGAEVPVAPSTEYSMFNVPNVTTSVRNRETVISLLSNSQSASTNVLTKEEVVDAYVKCGKYFARTLLHAGTAVLSSNFGPAGLPIAVGQTANMLVFGGLTAVTCADAVEKRKTYIKQNPSSDPTDNGPNEFENMEHRQPIQGRTFAV